MTRNHYPRDHKPGHPYVFPSLYLSWKLTSLIPAWSWSTDGPELALGWSLSPSMHPNGPQNRLTQPTQARTSTLTTIARQRWANDIEMCVWQNFMFIYFCERIFTCLDPRNLCHALAASPLGQTSQELAGERVTEVSLWFTHGGTWHGAAGFGWTCLRATVRKLGSHVTVTIRPRRRFSRSLRVSYLVLRCAWRSNVGSSPSAPTWPLC